MKEGGDFHGDGSPPLPSVFLSRTDRGHERRGAAVLVGIIALTAGTPIVIGLLSGQGLPTLSMAALLPWMFNFWLFGWARMVISTAQLHAFPTRQPVVDAISEERLGQGVLGSNGCSDGTAQIQVSLKNNRPTAEAWITSGAGEKRAIGDLAAYTWAHALSGGNLLSLSGCFLSATVSSNNRPTAHHSIACQQAFHAAERVAVRDFVSADGWHTTLSKWLPGRMPA